MYCYILSSRLFTKKLYKFGKTILSREELIKCYRRYIPDVEILEYYPSSNHHKDETKILDKFSNYRYVNHDGHITEWLDIEFSKLKSYCDKFFKKSIAKLAKKELVKKIDVEKELRGLESSGYDISLEKACYILNKNDIYENYIGDLDFRENFIGENSNCDFTMKNLDGIEIPWFTLEGFKNFCSMFICKESNNIKKYYEKIELQNKINKMIFEKDGEYLITIKNEIELVNKLLHEYNPEMKDEIHVYGNEEETLFIPSEIRDIIEVTDSTFKRKMRELDENEHYITCDYVGYAMTKNGEITKPQSRKRLLTKYGLYKILVKNNKNIPEEIINLIF